MLLEQADKKNRSELFGSYYLTKLGSTRAYILMGISGQELAREKLTGEELSKRKCREKLSLRIYVLNAGSQGGQHSLIHDILTRKINKQTNKSREIFLPSL